MKDKNILTLRPKDYLVTSSGLKIENVTEDMLIEVEMPESLTITPIVNELKVSIPESDLGR